MDNTKVSMSLLNYERLKECQKSYTDLIKEIKSIYKTANMQESAVEITIDKERLERLLINYAPEDIERRGSLDNAQVSFLYK